MSPPDLLSVPTLGALHWAPGFLCLRPAVSGCGAAGVGLDMVRHPLLPLVSHWGQPGPRGWRFSGGCRNLSTSSVQVLVASSTNSLGCRKSPAHHPVTPHLQAQLQISSRHHMILVQSQPAQSGLWPLASQFLLPAMTY